MSLKTLEYPQPWFIWINSCLSIISFHSYFILQMSQIICVGNSFATFFFLYVIILVYSSIQLIYRKNRYISTSIFHTNSSIRSIQPICILHYYHFTMKSIICQLFYYRLLGRFQKCYLS